jgi:Asp-tRNA(Asn)/Glu-tRNA(Gln) amidotransferase A subunit family amidase
VTTDTIFAPAARLAREVHNGERTSVGVLETSLDRIDAHNDDVNALVTVTAEGARERARDLQALLADYDLLLTPTLAVTPPPIGDEQVSEVDGQEIEPYAGWLLT